MPLAAATVVLLRPAVEGLEVLLTRRPSTMAFGPGLHVFPGGRVEGADREPGAVADLTPDEAAERLGHGLAPDPGMTPGLALALHAAAVRETREEAGIEIHAADLVPMTRWVTPPSLARRFDVRFFAAFVPPGTEVAGESGEVVDATWLTPAEALRAAGDGRLAVWQPTFVTLQQLDGLEDEPAVREEFAPGAMTSGPLLEVVEPGVIRIDAPWAAGIPGRKATGWLVGAEDVIAIDPADPTTTTLDAIQDHLGGDRRRLVGAVVTSLDPRRHAGVEMLAHGLGIPVVGDARARAWTPYPIEWLPLDAPVPFADGTPDLAEVLARTR